MKINLSVLVNQSKVQMALCLLLISVSAIISSHSLESLLAIVLAVLSTLVMDLILVRIRKIRPFFPSAAIVSGLIIGLLTYYQLPWYLIMLTGIIAMAGKNFLRIKNRHIFNPAGFGVLLSALIFHQHVSWWGVSFQNDFPSLTMISTGFLILLTTGLVSIIRMRRYFITFTFLAVYIILSALVLAFIDQLNPLKILPINVLMVAQQPTVLFFSLVMLPEPMTSPHDHKKQTLYGILVSILAVLFSIAFPGSLLDPLLGALLVGNAVFSNLKFLKLAA